MSATDIIKARIRAYVAEAELTAYAIAKKTQLAEGTLRRINDPLWNPTAATLDLVEGIIPPGWAPKGSQAPRRIGKRS